MDYDEILKRIIIVVKEFCAVNKDSISEATLISNDLGINSLKVIELMIGLEEEFDIVFNDGAIIMENFKSIGTISEIVSKKLTTYDGMV